MNATTTMPAMPAMPSMRKGSNRPTRPCACGCGQPTKATWHPGHDGRATGWAIRIERGIIKMGEIPANERAGAAIMTERRAKAKATEAKATETEAKATETEAAEAA